MIISLLFILFIWEQQKISLHHQQLQQQNLEEKNE